MESSTRRQKPSTQLPNLRESAPQTSFGSLGSGDERAYCKTRTRPGTRVVHSQVPGLRHRVCALRHRQKRSGRQPEKQHGHR